MLFVHSRVPRLTCLYGRGPNKRTGESKKKKMENGVIETTETDKPRPANLQDTHAHRRSTFALKRTGTGRTTR